MSLRDHYENLDQYTMYDYKDVSNAYRHGEYDAIDRVLDIIDQMDKENEKCNGDISRLLLRIEHKDFRERVLALKGGDMG